jgi:hypothetical protein
MLYQSSVVIAEGAKREAVRTRHLTAVFESSFWKHLWCGVTNKTALAVSRQFATPQLQLCVVGNRRHTISLIGLCVVALLLGESTARNTDQMPAPPPIRTVAVVSRTADKLRTPPALIAREAAARSAVLRPAAGIPRAENRFEPALSVDSRHEVTLICNPQHQAFDGPMWRFLLNEPVRPDIDLKHNASYYGVKVTLPLGG